MRRKILKNKTAAWVLRAVEKKAKKTLKIVTGKESSFDPDTFTITLGPRSALSALFTGADWANRLLFHELAQAIFDQFHEKFDRNAYKNIFGGGLAARYPKGNLARATAWINGVRRGRSGVSRYSALHPEESFRRLFRFRSRTSMIGPRTLRRFGSSRSPIG